MDVLNNLRHRALLNNSFDAITSIDKFAMALRDNPSKLSADSYIINRKIPFSSLEELETNKKQLQQFFDYLNKPPQSLIIPKKVILNYFLWKDFIPTDENGNELNQSVSVTNLPN